MPTYSTEDFENIAEAIGKSPAHVLQYANRFEAAAAWHRSYCRAPTGARLTNTAKRLQQIANAARNLLRRLEVYDYRKASDGPGDITLLHSSPPPKTLVRTKSSMQLNKSDVWLRFSRRSTPVKSLSAAVAKLRRMPDA